MYANTCSHTIFVTLFDTASSLTEQLNDERRCAVLYRDAKGLVCLELHEGRRTKGRRHLNEVSTTLRWLHDYTSIKDCLPAEIKKAYVTALLLLCHLIICSFKFGILYSLIKLRAKKILTEYRDLKFLVCHSLIDTGKYLIFQI